MRQAVNTERNWHRFGDESFNVEPKGLRLFERADFKWTVVKLTCLLGGFNADV
jgi:hypothetical protein